MSQATRAAMNEKHYLSDLVYTHFIGDVRLFWTKTGKEFSKAAYNRIPDCLNDLIDEELYQAHSDSL